MNKNILSKIQLLLLIFLSNSSCAFSETKTDNLTDEFIDTAMKLPADTTAPVSVNITNIKPVSDITNSHNFFQVISDYFNHLIEKLQSFGHIISHQLERVIGNNPFLVKLLVVLLFVVVSIIIILILVIIAKKFIFKNQQETAENIVSEKEKKELPAKTDLQKPDKQNENKQIQEQKTPEEQKQENISNTSTIKAQENNNQKNSNIKNQSANSSKSIEEAMKIFLKVTE